LYGGGGGSGTKQNINSYGFLFLLGFGGGYSGTKRYIIIDNFSPRFLPWVTVVNGKHILIFFLL
jgi:hypothetical protein